jgi:hypothetical protein
LLLGLKGSLNEYELDLLRQRSLEARREKAKRGELIVAAPVGYHKTEDQRLEKDPDLRVQDAIRSVFHQFGAIASVRQTLLWFLEHGLQLPACTPRGELQWKRPRKNAESVLRCGREPFETAAMLEVPQWMLDPVACCHITSSRSPAQQALQFPLCFTVESV